MTVRNKENCYMKKNGYTSLLKHSYKYKVKAGKQSFFIPFHLIAQVLFFVAAKAPKKKFNRRTV